MASLFTVNLQDWHLTIVCRAVKVRLGRSEAPGRKEFKAYKDRLEQQ
jgi:hypothetical protein